MPQRRVNMTQFNQTVQDPLRQVGLRYASLAAIFRKLSASRSDLLISVLRQDSACFDICLSEGRA